MARARLALEASKAKAEQQTYTPEQLAAISPGIPVPPIPMTLAEHGKWLATQHTGEELKTAARLNDPHEIEIQKSVPGVVDSAGQTVKFADKDIAAKVADAKAGADETVRLTDDLIAMIQRNGWSSDFVKSKQWRQAQQNYGEILIRKKETDKLGVLTGPDVGIVTKEIGTDDPTEARGQQVIEALKHFRHNQVEGFNSTIRNKAVVPEGRTLQRWEPPPPPEPHRDTEAERAAKEVLQNPQTTWESERIAKELGAPSMRAAEDRLHALGGVMPSQRATIDAWARDATGVDEAKRTAALASLESTANQAEVPGVRAAAREALTNVIGSVPLPSSAPAGPPDQATAQETVPPKVYERPKGVR